MLALLNVGEGAACAGCLAQLGTNACKQGNKELVVVVSHACW